jgi:hypothetical protein
MKKRILPTLLGLVTMVVVISITNCKSANIISSTDPDKTTSIENFDDFYNRFHTDSLFQMSRIKFPLKGIKVDYEGEKKWSGKNWITMKTKIQDVDTSEFSTEYQKTDKSFMEKFWIEDTGYSSEYRFKLIRKKWYLVYANEQNL